MSLSVCNFSSCLPTTTAGQKEEGKEAKYAARGSASAAGKSGNEARTIDPGYVDGKGRSRTVHQLLSAVGSLVAYHHKKLEMLLIA